MNVKQVALLTVMGLTASGLLPSAIAAPVGFTTHKDAKGAIWVGGPENGEVVVAISNVDKTKNLRVNACGIVTIKDTQTSPAPDTFQVGSNTVVKANLPTQLLPKCLTTGQLEETRSNNFKTSDGTIVLVGLPANGTTEMAYKVTVNKRVKMNACGFGKISNSSTKPFNANNGIQIAGGAPVSYLDIPNRPAWQCKAGITYQPLLPAGS